MPLRHRAKPGGDHMINALDLLVLDLELQLRALSDRSREFAIVEIARRAVVTMSN